jgi:hypothetical protein
MERARIEPAKSADAEILSQRSIMLQTNPHPSPLQYEVEVGEQGQIQLQVPFQVGQKIVVLVMEPLQDNDLVAASTSSLAFWDNDIDDAQWPAEILNYQGDRDFPAFESYRDELLPLSEPELF